MAEAPTAHGGLELRIDGTEETPRQLDHSSSIPRHSLPPSGGSQAQSSRTTGSRPHDEVSRLNAEQREEMGTRGSLEMKDRAVERIAEAATLEVAGVALATNTTSLSTSLGKALGRAYPRVDVHVAGRRVRAHVEIVTLWPHPAAQIAAAVREHVSDRLHVLANLDVDAVQVDVTRVIRPRTPERKRV